VNGLHEDGINEESEADKSEADEKDVKKRKIDMPQIDIEANPAFNDDTLHSVAPEPDHTYITMEELASKRLPDTGMFRILLEWHYL
jgi:hypothetical protein